MQPSSFYVRIVHKNDTGDTVTLGSGILLNNTTVISCFHVINTEKAKNNPVFYAEIPESHFSFPIPLKIFQSQPTIDLVIFKIETPLDHLDYPITFLKSGYSKLTSEICSVYIKKNKTSYGWTEARVDYKSHDYLIQTTRITEKHVPVNRGHSGAAVWYNNKGSKMVIGMVKNADGMDRFDFVSGEDIIPYLDGINLSSLDIKKLYLTPTYLRLDRYYQPCASFIREQPNLNKILCLYGISGIGKTSLSTDLVKNTESNFEWIDCTLVNDQAIFSRVIDKLDKNDFVILDSLFKNHKFFTQNWLDQLSKEVNFIITTSCSVCKRRIESWNGKYEKYSLKTVELNGFNTEEGIAFLKPIDNKYIDLHLKETIFKVSKGVPLILTLIMDMIDFEIEKKQDEYDSFEDNQYVFQILDREFSEEKIAEIVITRWFQHANIHKIKKEILYLVSCISNIGMTLNSISQTLKRPVSEISKPLENLRQKGFITVKQDPENSEKLITAHDSIKKIAHQIKGFDKQKFEESFFQYIQNDGQKIECGLVTRIDALILKMKGIWEKSNTRLTTSSSVDFMTQLERYSNELNSLIPSNAGSSEKSKWIAELFDPLTSENCTVLIPLARTMSPLNANMMIAELAWSALDKNIMNEEADSFMARANLICAAFSHWRRLPHLEKSLILEKSKEHLINLEIHQRMNSINDPDLEASMIIGGLCSIGLTEDAMEIVMKGRFSQFNDEMDLSYLMILASLLDGPITELKKKHIEDFMNARLAYTTENEAKDDMIAYIEYKGFIIDKARFKNKKEFYFNGNNDKLSGLSMAIAKITNCNEFRTFVIEERKNGAEVWI